MSKNLLNLSHLFKSVKSEDAQRNKHSRLVRKFAETSGKYQSI